MPATDDLTTTVDSKQSCWKVLLDALYFIFSQHYSTLFRASALGLDRSAVVNETIHGLIKDRNLSDSVVIMPTLRDMRTFFDKYKHSVQNRVNSKMKFCDPQPPILCNWIFILMVNFKNKLKENSAFL